MWPARVFAPVLWAWRYWAHGAATAHPATATLRRQAPATSASATPTATRTGASVLARQVWGE